jgi:hypothetical protein
LAQLPAKTWTPRFCGGGDASFATGGFCAMAGALSIMDVQLTSPDVRYGQ